MGFPPETQPEQIKREDLWQPQAWEPKAEMHFAYMEVLGFSALPPEGEVSVDTNEHSRRKA